MEKTVGGYAPDRFHKTGCPISAIFWFLPTSILDFVSAFICSVTHPT